MTTVIAKARLDEPVTDDNRAKAIQQARDSAKSRLMATSVEYLPKTESLLIHLGDDSGFLLPLKNYPELAVLSGSERAKLVLGLGGSALCLEDRDLHVSIAGLVSASAPLMAFAASMVGARNGAQASPAKAMASRTNGAKGGRPRKLALEG